MKKKLTKKISKNSIKKKLSSKRKWKNPDLNIIEQQILKLCNKKVAIITDDNIYGILKCKNTDKRFISVRKMEHDFEVISSFRTGPEPWQLFEDLWGFNFNDVDKIVGRLVYLK